MHFSIKADYYDLEQELHQIPLHQFVSFLWQCDQSQMGRPACAKKGVFFHTERTLKLGTWELI